MQGGAANRRLVPWTRGVASHAISSTSYYCRENTGRRDNAVTRHVCGRTRSFMRVAVQNGTGCTPDRPSIRKQSCPIEAEADHRTVRHTVTDTPGMMFSNTVQFRPAAFRAGRGPDRTPPGPKGAVSSLKRDMRLEGGERMPAEYCTVTRV